MTALILCSIAVGIIIGTDTYFIVKYLKTNKKLMKKEKTEEKEISEKDMEVKEKVATAIQDNREEEVYGRFLRGERENKWSKGE